MIQAPDGYYFRDLVEDDMPQLVEIINHYILNTAAVWRSNPETVDERETWLHSTKKAGYPALGAFESSTNKLAGYASCAAFRPGDGYKHTVEVAIIFGPTYTKKGVGHFLLHRLMEVAREAGFHTMISSISGTNPGSQKFFAREGYAKVGHLPGIGVKKGVVMDLTFWQYNLQEQQATLQEK